MKAPDFWIVKGNAKIVIKHYDYYIDMVGRKHNKESFVLRYKKRKIGVAFNKTSAEDLAKQFNIKDLDYSIHRMN